jgi:hypothetical protein
VLTKTEPPSRYPLMFDELSLEITRPAFWFFTALMCLFLNVISPVIMPALHFLRKRASVFLAKRSATWKDFVEHRKKVRRIVVLHYLTTPEVRAEFRHQETRSRWLATQSTVLAVLALFLSVAWRERTPVLAGFLVILGMIGVTSIVIHWRKAGKVAATIDDAFDMRNAHSDEEMVKVFSEFVEAEKKRLGGE